ncbi:MAG: hypothetical protein QG650_419, partial [Patescibacteria group bacterium]|nr:hypothetical protein [Patescibacteria group bacterium]
ARLDWNTPDGRRVTGYVGQHVGVIVGAKIGNDGKIEEVSYYEGRSSEIQKEPFESLSRKAKWFNEAIYVSTVEKSGTGAEKIKTRKKNVRTAVSRTIKKSG